MDDRLRELLHDRAGDIPAQWEMPVQVRRRVRRRIATTVAATLAVAVGLIVGAVMAVRSFTASAPRPANPGPTPGRSLPVDPTPDRCEIGHGWPGPGWNRPGLYSWDGPGGPGGGRDGWMHNGNGSGDLELSIQDVGGPVTDDGARAVTVAGHDGFYRRIDAGREEWIVNIKGTRLAIAFWLKARPGTSQADLAEAHAIIESMRTDPCDNQLGFVLLFTLTTNHWDSG